MDGAQTLYSRLDPSAHGRHGWAEFWDTWREGCHLVSSAPYLSSPVSRRGVRALLWPAYVIPGAFIDLTSPLPAEYSDHSAGIKCLTILGLSLGIIGSCCLPAHSWWSDFVIVSSLAASDAPVRWWYPVEEAMASYVPTTIAILCACGIHAGFGFAYALCMFILHRLWDAVDCFSLLLAISCASVAFFFDIRCARIVAELERERHAVYQLLLNAGHGWCAVRIDDGTITTFSAKLAETFGTSDLSGVEFAHFVAGKDRMSMAEFFKLIDNEGTLAPILVTCHARQYEFDAKIIPFAVVAKHIRLCIQIQGQRRFQAQVHSDANAIQVGTSEFAERSSTSVRRSTTSLGLSLSIQRVTRVERIIQTDAVQFHGRPPLPLPGICFPRPAMPTHAQTGCRSLLSGSRPQSERRPRGRGIASANGSTTLAVETARREDTDNEAADPSGSEQDAPDHTETCLVPRLVEDSGIQSTSFVLDCTTNRVVGCTVGFRALTGPLLFKTHMRDLVRNLTDFRRWIGEQTNELLYDADHECLPFGIKLARLSLRHHAKFEFHAGVRIVECAEDAMASELGVEPVEGVEEEQHDLLCLLTLTDVQVQWVGDGKLPNLRTHRAVGDAESAASSSFEQGPAAEAQCRLVPEMQDEGAHGANSALVCVEETTILASTCGFNSLAGPLLVGTTLRDLVTNYKEFSKWMQSQAGDLLAKRIQCKKRQVVQESQPFEIQISPQIYKNHGGFEIHAAAYLILNETVVLNPMPGSEPLGSGENEAHVVLELREVRVHSHPRRKRSCGIGSTR